MDIRNLRRWIRLRIGTIDTAREACLNQGDAHHHTGRQTGAEEPRAEAERFHAAAKDLRDAQHEDGKPDMRQCTDDSIHGNSAPVQSTRIHLAKDAREIIVSTIAAAAVITCLVLWSKLHDAEKDIQTQIWLRDDALTKFEQGPFADLKAHTLALELNCKKER